MNTPVCKCNNCDQLLIDKNPCIDPATVKDPAGLKELILLLDGDGPMRACPNCKTDSYLTDLEKVLS